MNESQLVRTIKAHIAKGDHASEKAEQHYIAAGQHLKALKAQHGGTWAEWAALLKNRVGIGKSRASELMQIADGRRTIEQVRAATGERTARTRALQSSSLSLRYVAERLVCRGAIIAPSVALAQSALSVQRRTLKSWIVPIAANQAASLRLATARPSTSPGPWRHDG